MPEDLRRRSLNQGLLNLPAGIAGDLGMGITENPPISRGEPGSFENAFSGFMDSIGERVASYIGPPGKFVGGTLGSILGGPIGGLLGRYGGGMLDRGAQKSAKPAQINPLSGMPPGPSTSIGSVGVSGPGAMSGFPIAAMPGVAASTGLSGLLAGMFR